MTTMRKAIAGGLAALALVVSAFVVAPDVWSQGVPDRPLPDRRMMMLDGRGSQIGVSVRDLDTADLSKAGLQQAGGVVIQDVEEASPAEKAGIRAGDVIVEFDGERVRSARQFSRLVQDTPDGRTVKATLVRDRSRQTVDVTPETGFGRFSRDRDGRFSADIVMPDIQREIERGLRDLPRNFSFDFDMPVPGIVMGARARLGLSLTPLTDQLASYFGAREGVLVSSVEPESAAAKAGVKAGDVITSINGRSVNEPRDVSEDLRDADAGSTIEIGIVRDKKASTLKATIPERPVRRNVRPV
jgi:serine protease Do